MKRVKIFLLSILVATVAHAQQIGVQAPDVVGAKERFTVRYTVNDKAQNFREPKVSNAKKLVGPSTSNNSSISFVNGQLKESHSTTFQFVYEAGESGTVTLSAASCSSGGATLSSEPISIKIDRNRKSQQQQQQTSGDPWDDWGDPFASIRQMQQQMRQQMGMGQSQSQSSRPATKIDEKSLFARASVSNSHPYQGEQIIITYKVYTQVSLRQFTIDKLPGNRGFWAEDLTGNQREVKQWEETIDGRKYMVAEIRRGALYAQEDGKLRIEPLDLDVLAMVPRQRSGSIFDLFDDPFFNLGQAVERHLRTNAINVDVRRLPAAPASYCGGVGSFKITADADTRSTRANEAITYKLTVQGRGNLMLIEAPQIDFPSSFEVYEPKIDDNIKRGPDGVSGSRTFEWVLIPRSQGDFEIPAYEISYFDPSKGSYETQSMPAMPLHIDKADPRATHNVTGSGQQIDVLNHDINYIHTADSTLRHAKDYSRIEWWFWLALAIIVAASLLIPLFSRRRAAMNEDVAGMRMRRATRAAQKRMRRAAAHLKDGNDEKFYEEVYKAIWGCLADKYNIDLATLSSDTVREHLERKNIAPQQRDEILQTLQDVDFARFAPGDSGSKKQTIYDKALHMIRDIALIIIVLLLPASQAAQAAGIDDANHLYQQGDYTAAAAAYEHLAAQGYASPTLFYNLGNSYFRLEDWGHAILNYRRSLKLKPNDRDAKENLRMAESRTTDRIEALPSVRMKESLSSAVGILSAKGWRIAVLALAFIAGACYTMFRIAPRRRQRKSAFITSVAATLLLVVAAVCAISTQRTLSHIDTFVVLQPEAAILSAPEEASTIKFVVHEGTTANIEEQLGSWYRIRLADGNNGWINTSDGEAL